MRTIKFRAWDNKEKRMYDDVVLNPIPFYAGYLNFIGMVRMDNRFILMQFTGLHDKNGKEIYHKDIGDKDGETGSIQYDDGCWWFVNRWGQITALYLCVNDICIIGNIHENPELLKGD